MHYFADISIQLDGGAAMLAIGLVFFCVIFVISIPFVALAAIMRRRAESAFRARQGTVVALYDPPLNLKPAELGMLYDMRCDTKELQATLFDLTRRHIITLTNERATVVASQQAYDDLEEFEKIAINATDTSSSIVKESRPVSITLLVDGKPQTVNFNLPAGSSLASFKMAVRQSLNKKGYPIRSFAVALFLRALIIAIIIGQWPIAVMALTSQNGMISMNNQMISVFSGEVLSWCFFVSLVCYLIFFPIYLLTGYAIVGAWSKIAGRAWLGGHKARALWPQLEGYRLFLKQAELDQIQFESVDPYDDPISVALPYAIVFNLDTKWQERFNKK